jgi:endonuclease-3
MAGSRGGPRQPLSQRRPKAAAERSRAKSVPTKAGRPTSDASTTRKPGVGAPASTRPPAAGSRPGSASRAPARRSRAAVPDTADLYDRLTRLYPDAHCELDFRNAFELLVATILSAQCTDRRVNMVTPVLFARYPTPAALSAAKQEEVEEIIRSTGFFRNKAKSIIAMAGALVDRHGGEVPATIDELVRLPGVGRKTANVILGNAFGLAEGVVVDTHVARLAARLGLTSETDPVRIEQALMPLFPRERWTMLAHLLIWHGRRVCDARKPRCAECALVEICPRVGVRT